MNTRIRRRCGALGFLASALLHLALVLVWIGLAARPESPPATLAESAVPITLAMFADPGVVASSPAQVPATAIPEPPESAPEPQPSEPAPDGEPDRPSDLSSSPRVEPRPSPRVVAEPKPRPKPKPEAKTPSPKAKPKAVFPKTETAQVAPEVTAVGMAPPGPAPLPASSAPVAAPALPAPNPAPNLAELRSGYLSALRSAIAANKYYPDSARRRQEQGMALVAFVLEADGRIHRVQVDTSSGFAAIDEAAVAAVERLGRFQPIPRELQRERWELKVPISFAILDNQR